MLRNSADDIQQTEPMVDMPIVSAHKREETSQTCCSLPALIVGPVFWVGATDAADILMSMHIAKRSIPEASVAALIAFLSSTGLNFGSSIDGMAEICRIARTRSLPSEWPDATRDQRKEWPQLPRRKNVAAFVLCILPTAVATVGYTCSAIYLVSPTPKDWEFWDTNNRTYQLLWDCLVTTPAAISATLTIAFTVAPESFKALRQILAWESGQYSSTFSKWLSIILGGGLGVCDSIQDSINCFISIVSVFNAKDTIYKYPIAGLAGINLFAYFSFSGRFGVNAVDEFCGHIASRKFKAAKILAFGSVFAMSAYLAYLKMPLNREFYHEVYDDFFTPNDASVSDDAATNLFIETLFTVFSWIIFFQDTLLGSASMYDPMLSLIKKIIRCCGKSDQVEELDSEDENEADFTFEHNNENDDEEQLQHLIDKTPEDFDAQEETLKSEEKEQIESINAVELTSTVATTVKNPNYSLARTPSTLFSHLSHDDYTPRPATASRCCPPSCY